MKEETKLTIYEYFLLFVGSMALSVGITLFFNVNYTDVLWWILFVPLMYMIVKFIRLHTGALRDAHAESKRNKIYDHINKIKEDHPEPNSWDQVSNKKGTNINGYKKGRVYLNKDNVHVIEMKISHGATMKQIMDQFNISETVFRKIQRGTHRYSTKK